MATVTQCDACNNVVKNEDSKYVRINRCTPDNKIGNSLVELDICPQCYEKLCKLLNVKDKT